MLRPFTLMHSPMGDGDAEESGVLGQWEIVRGRWRLWEKNMCSMSAVQGSSLIHVWQPEKATEEEERGRMEIGRRGGFTLSPRDPRSLNNLDESGYTHSHRHTNRETGWRLFFLTLLPG